MVTAVPVGCDNWNSLNSTCCTDQLYTYHFTTQCIPCVLILGETPPKLNQSLNNLVLRLSDHPVFEHTLEVIKNWTVGMLRLHCKKGIVIQKFVTSDSDEWTKVEENYMTIFASFSANFPAHHHTILAINCVHASNWFTHLQPTWQNDGQNDNSVLTVWERGHWVGNQGAIQLSLMHGQWTGLDFIVGVLIAAPQNILFYILGAQYHR